MKKQLLIFTFFYLAFSAQENKALYIKANALFLPIGVVNVGVEYQLSTKYTVQVDGLISPWKKFDGKHAQIYMGHIEGRYYFSEAFKHWYVGANTGFGYFDITKFNYFGTTNFQRGVSIMFGGVAGYQFQWKEKWNIDLFIGGGTMQSFYRGYNVIDGQEVRVDGEDGANKSGEFLPYRGGLMISYKIK